MSQGKFNFLNIHICAADELIHLHQITPDWLELGYKIYANHSGEWYARKMGPKNYCVVSYNTLVTEGWRTEGFATTLKGVREVIEILHNDKEAKKSWIWS